jgi:Zn-finger nucleic acid-binding protein
MSPPTALHCGGCGAELGLEPIDDAAGLACPACVVSLRTFGDASGKLHDCGRCGGQFVEGALLQELLERRALVGGAVPRRALARSTALAEVRYIPCPACKKLMGRKNFGGTSGVIVDVCVTHGVWFDAGELPRVLAFVEKGGLAEERRRAHAEAEQRRHERAAAHALPERDARIGLSGPNPDALDPSVHHATPAAWTHGFADDARAVWATLLEQIGRALRREP